MYFATPTATAVAVQQKQDIVSPKPGHCTATNCTSTISLWEKGPSLRVRDRLADNEVMTGKNAAPRYRLALVKVDPRGHQHDEVRYLDDPFANTDLGDFDADRYFVLPAGPPLPGEVPAAA